MSKPNSTYLLMCSKIGILSKFYYKPNWIKQNDTWHIVNVSYFSSPYKRFCLPIFNSPPFMLVTEMFLIKLNAFKLGKGNLVNVGQVMGDVAEVAGVPEEKKGILNADTDPDAEWTRRLRQGTGRV